MLTDGKFQKDIRLYVPKSNMNVSIPTISNQPVKFLEKTISFTVSHKNQTEALSKAAQLSLQGKLIKCCNFLGLDLLWKTTQAVPKSLLSFSLSATCDTLPSP